MKILILKMPSLNIYFLTTFMVISIHSLTSKSVPIIHRSHFCSSTTFFPNSPYQSNLNHLLLSLYSNAKVGKHFYQITAGDGPSTTLYGSYLCRGDVDADTCRGCLATATDEATERCPLRKEAVLWYDVCMIRYSNRSFFKVMDEKPSSTLVDPWNGTNEERFRKALKEALMSGFALSEASNGPKKFRTKETKVSAYQTIYSLLQCTPDLSSEQCRRCLGDAIGLIPSCCDEKEGATILFPSCNVRYEVFLFYNQTSTSMESKPKG